MKTLRKKYLYFVLWLRCLIFSVRMWFSVWLRIFRAFNSDNKKDNAKAE